MSALAFPVVVAALMLFAAWASASVLFPVWTLAARRIPGLARVIPLIAVLPLVAAVVLGVAAVLPADPHLDQPFGCHCASSMPAWSHLCPVHPSEALGLLPVALFVFVALVPTRLRELRQLAREPLGLGGGTRSWVQVELAQPTARLVGWLRPTLVVDPRFWMALSVPERDAVIAHERAHLRRRDPLLLMALRMLTMVAPRRVAKPLLHTWLDRAELRADALAAREVGDPLVLAEALVRCARLSLPPAARAISWTGGSLEHRVQRLLADDGRPVSAAPDAGIPDALVLFGLVCAALGVTPWVHHQVEHLLNLSL